MSLFRLHGALRVFAFLLIGLATTPAGSRPQSSGTVPWPPPNIDHAVPPVKPGVSCPLSEVLDRASKRVQELVVSMQRISTTEWVEFSEVDASGALHSTAKAQFTYVADIHEVRPGQLTVEEYRNDHPGVQAFPTKLATTGTAALALIFHPLYLHDFSVTCEGLADLNGRPAWQVHLVQVRANNFRGYRLANRYFQVMLKGRAWIDAESHEVLRLETDLLKTIPEIPLLLEHIVIDYGAVEFPNRKLQLWLPQTADIYMDFRGRRYRLRHSFSRFQLFWVDTEEKVKTPNGM